MVETRNPTVRVPWSPEVAAAAKIEQLFGIPMPGPKIGFFGLPLAALLLLEDGHEIRWAVLSPIEAGGRRRLRRALPPGCLVDLNDDDLGFERHVDKLFDESPVDLVVSWFFTRRIPERWLCRPPLGAIGVHPSLLPRHRGPNPFYWAIDAGDTETGVTVHRLEAEYDTGAILAQRRILVGERNAWQLARALDRPSLGALREVVGDFAAGCPSAGKTQNAEMFTWAPEPTGDQLRVDWNWPTERVLRRIRALSPVPGLALELNGRRFFVTEACPASGFPSALLPGEAMLGPRLLLRTGDGAVVVERAQMAPIMTAASAGPDSDEDFGGHELRGGSLVSHLRTPQ